MNQKQWRDFFLACSGVLGEGGDKPICSENWCSWTTFGRLLMDAGYWTSGLPKEKDIFESYIGDGGNWEQPFGYDELAHVIIPKSFYWEGFDDNGTFQSGTKSQDILSLSQELDRLEVPHRLTDIVLEIKLY